MLEYLGNTDEQSDAALCLDTFVQSLVSDFGPEAAGQALAIVLASHLARYPSPKARAALSYIDQVSASMRNAIDEHTTQ